MFLYKTTLHLEDKTASLLKIKLECPFVILWKTKDKHILLTGPFTIIKNAKLLDYYECKMTETAWIIDAYLPFPWENNYVFEYFKRSVCILKNTKPKRKEIITHEIRTTPVPKRRYRKVTEVQNLWDTKQTENRQDPNIINTLI